MTGYQRQRDLDMRPRARPAPPAAGQKRIFLDEDGEPQLQDENDTLTPLRTTQLSQIGDAGSMAGQDADAAAVTGGSVRATTGLGYNDGAGGAITQTSSKSNAVTLNKLTGKITTASSTIAGEDSASFTLNNSEIEAEDHILVQYFSGGTPAYYVVDGWVSGAGTATIQIRNIDTSGHGEVLVLKFTVIKGTAS